MPRRVDYQQQYQREETELDADRPQEGGPPAECGGIRGLGSYLTLFCLLEHHEAQALHHTAETLDSQVRELEKAIAAKQAEIRDLPSGEDLLRRRDAAKRQQRKAIDQKREVIREEEKNKLAITTLEARISALEPKARLALGMTVVAAETAANGAEKALQEARDDYGTAQAGTGRRPGISDWHA